MKRAERKKVMKQFKLGDSVTWGNGATSHCVVEVRPTGVVVDVTSQKDAKHFAEQRTDGRLFLFVAFDRNNRNRSGRGPVRHAAPTKQTRFK
jgi:hypothetical protein